MNTSFPPPGDPSGFQHPHPKTTPTGGSISKASDKNHLEYNAAASLLKLFNTSPPAQQTPSSRGSRSPIGPTQQDSTAAKGPVQAPVDPRDKKIVPWSQWSSEEIATLTPYLESASPLTPGLLDKIRKELLDKHGAERSNSAISAKMGKMRRESRPSSQPLSWIDLSDNAPPSRKSSEFKYNWRNLSKSDFQKKTDK